MPRREKNRRSVVDADDRVARRVKNDQRAAQCGNCSGKLLRGNILEEFAADSELATGELHLGFAASVDFGALAGKQMRDMCRIGGRVDRCDRHRIRHAPRCREHCRATQAVSDHDRWRLVLTLEPVRGSDEIGNVRGERCIREIAFRVAQTREVEAQDGNARVGQRFADERCGLAFFRAGEAMREQRVRPRCDCRWHVEPRGERVPARAGKRDGLAHAAHGGSFR